MAICIHHWSLFPQCFVNQNQQIVKYSINLTLIKNAWEHNYIFFVTVPRFVLLRSSQQGGLGAFAFLNFWIFLNFYKTEKVIWKISFSSRNVLGFFITQKRSLILLHFLTLTFLRNVSAFKTFSSGFLRFFFK